MITCVVYGQKEEFNSKEEAIAFFMEGCSYCDPASSEYNRYLYMIGQINSGLTYCTDENY